MIEIWANERGTLVATWGRGPWGIVIHGVPVTRGEAVGLINEFGGLCSGVRVVSRASLERAA